MAATRRSGDSPAVTHGNGGRGGGGLRGPQPCAARLEAGPRGQGLAVNLTQHRGPTGAGTTRRGARGR